MAGTLALAILISAVPALSTSQDSAALSPRSEYDIPLAKLAASADFTDGLCEKVRISYEGADDYTVITPYDDQYVKLTRTGRETTVYRENINYAFVISDFEARELNRVCKSFIACLKQFEENLQKGRWGKVLYLDAYFPRFLSGFFHLYCTARNTPEAMPPAARVPDSLYDISLASAKTDARIESWRQDPERLLKLRIISKELGFQLQTWQNKELSPSRRSAEISYGEDLEKAFSLFVRYYFNLRAPTK